MPQLVLIDGGKGQLEAAIAARDARGMNVPFISIAKKQEQIVIHHTGSHVQLNKEKLAQLDGYREVTKDFTLVNLPHSTHIVKLLQRVRDESHRFAVSYHTVLKQKKQTSSELEEIPGIGPATKRKLLREFGSLKALRTAPTENVAACVGAAKAALIAQYIQDSSAG